VGETFEWESVAVVNATADREDPDSVRFQFELDNLAEEHLPKHMDELELAPEQADVGRGPRETRSGRVEDATE